MGQLFGGALAVWHRLVLVGLARLVAVTTKVTCGSYFVVAMLPLASLGWATHALRQGILTDL